jgi:hypothetical protein
MCSSVSKFSERGWSYFEATWNAAEQAVPLHERRGSDDAPDVEVNPPSPPTAEPEPPPRPPERLPTHHEERHWQKLMDLRLQCEWEMPVDLQCCDPDWKKRTRSADLRLVFAAVRFGFERAEFYEFAKVPGGRIGYEGWDYFCSLWELAESKIPPAERYKMPEPVPEERQLEYTPLAAPDWHERTCPNPRCLHLKRRDNFRSKRYLQADCAKYRCPHCGWLLREDRYGWWFERVESLPEGTVLYHGVCDKGSKEWNELTGKFKRVGGHRWNAAVKRCRRKDGRFVTMHFALNKWWYWSTQPMCDPNEVQLSRQEAVDSMRDRIQSAYLSAVIKRPFHECREWQFHPTRDAPEYMLDDSPGDIDLQAIKELCDELVVPCKWIKVKRKPSPERCWLRRILELELPADWTADDLAYWQYRLALLLKLPDKSAASGPEPSEPTAAEPKATELDLADI